MEPNTSPCRIGWSTRSRTQKVWDEDILEEDDVPEDGTSLDEVQLENDLKIVQWAFADRLKLLKGEKFGMDKEKLSAWFRARFSDSSTVLLAGTASKVIMTKEFADDMETQGRRCMGDLSPGIYSTVRRRDPAGRACCRICLLSECVQWLFMHACLSLSSYFTVTRLIQSQSLLL